MKAITGTAWSIESAQAYVKHHVSFARGGCWMWQRSRHRTGYGNATIPSAVAGSRSRCIRAHRLAYEAFVGPIENGLHVLHRCDVPACCNPEHLFLGTQADNMADMAAKRRNRCTVYPAGNVGERRKALGLTQERLAELVGVDRTTCVHWESGRRQPEGAVAERLELVLRALEAAQ